MKILLYVNSHLPRIGGRELVVHNLALQYQHLGHDVVVAGAGGYRQHGDLQLGYPVSRWPIVNSAPDLSRQVSLAVYAMLTRPDVVHAHSTYPCGYAAVRLGRFLRCPIVITPHGEDINVVPEISFGQRLDPAQRVKIEEAVRKADATTAISETIAASLEESGAPKEKILRIPNGVELVRFEGTQTGNTLERFQLSADQQIVVSTGNYHPRKGHEVLVEAVAHARSKCPGLALVIVGKTSEAFCKAVADKGYSGFVKFAGTLNVPLPGSGAEDPLADLLRAATLYISSSMDQGAEGLSLALMEAMAAGVCPIVTDISGNRDIINHNQNGLVVPPRDAMAMGDAISMILSSAGMARTLGDEAKRTVGQFGWDRVAERYVEAYAELIRNFRT